MKGSFGLPPESRRSQAVVECPLSALCLLKIPSEPQFERLRELLSKLDEANGAAI
jgi:hypothetical protein